MPMPRGLRRWIRFALHGLLLLAAFGAGYVGGARARGAPPPGDRWRLLEEVWQILEAHAYRPLPEPRLRLYGAIRGLLETLGDPYAMFVEPAAHREEVARLQGVDGGLPLHLQRSPEGWRVYPFPDSTAARAGIRPGDLLLGIEDRSISIDDSLEALQAQLRGPIGSPVRLRLRHPEAEAPYSLTLIREEVHIPSAWGHLLETEPPIGYLRIASFTTRTPEEVAGVLESLRRGSARGIVLDLRDNGGGLLESAVEVAGMFVGRVPIAVEHRRDRQTVVHRPRQPGPRFTGPLAVLVNGGTGSAAEILAAALAERGRGFLIGAPTFGKGSVQELFPLSDGSSIHLTVAEWRTAEGRTLEGQGLVPHIPLAPEQLEGEEAIRQAIAALRERIKADSPPGPPEDGRGNGRSPAPSHAVTADGG